MAYQITLTDEEYAALSAAAAQTGQTVDELAHAAIAARYAPTSGSQAPQQPAMTQDEFQQYLLSKGLITHIPSRVPDTPEEEAELEEIIKSIKPGKPASEMIIEDRGPR